MAEQIRDYRQGDREAVVAFSLRAWAPSFASTERVVGRDLFVRLHGDWREYQALSVAQTLANPAMRVWVAEVNEAVVGFVAAMLHPERLIGEIAMLAVDPDHQSQGVGLRLTQFATDWLRDAGMRVAMVETGGDPGHAAARHIYERAEYTPSPVARYFKAL